MSTSAARKRSPAVCSCPRTAQKSGTIYDCKQSEVRYGYTGFTVFSYRGARGKHYKSSGAASHDTTAALPKDLEEELGKQLLFRRSKRVTLTREGQLLRKRVEELVELMEKTKTEITTPDDLRNEPLFCSRQMLEGNGLSGWLGYDAEKLDMIGQYDLIFNAALMVEEGLGSALTLDKLCNTSAESRLAFVPLQPRLEVSLDLIWKKYQVFSSAASIFYPICNEPHGE